jgi:hypothetical protein
MKVVLTRDKILVFRYLLHGSCVLSFCISVCHSALTTAVAVTAKPVVAGELRAGQAVAHRRGTVCGDSRGTVQGVASHGTLD